MTKIHPPQLVINVLTGKAVLCYSALWYCRAALLGLVVVMVQAVSSVPACSNLCQPWLCITLPCFAAGTFTHTWSVSCYNITHCRPHLCTHLLLPKSLDILCRLCWKAHWVMEHNGTHVAVKQHHWSRLCLLLRYFHCSVVSRAEFSWPKFCPHFCARLLSTGFGSSEELMSVGTFALRDLKTSLQCPGYLLSSEWIFLLTLWSLTLGSSFALWGVGYCLSSQFTL